MWTYFWSIASMNCPITSGTLWIRLISSCARTSSRFKLRCSSLIYSSCRWMYLAHVSFVVRPIRYRDVL